MLDHSSFYTKYHSKLPGAGFASHFLPKTPFPAHYFPGIFFSACRTGKVPVWPAVQKAPEKYGKIGSGSHCRCEAQMPHGRRWNIGKHMGLAELATPDVRFDDAAHPV